MNTSKITTKKLLVSYDPSESERSSSDFLAPIKDSTGLFFLGLRSKRRRDKGQVVYVGKELTANDIFAKLVDSGCKIENVDNTLNVLETYLRLLQEFKIGNILVLEPCNDVGSGYRLKLVSNVAPVKPLPLP
jgi:hypothetical protein